MKFLLQRMAALLLGAGILYGQEEPSLTGTVTDPASGPIANAKLQLLSIDRVLETPSDNEGHFRFPLTKPGVYDLKVSSLGFRDRSLHLDLSSGGDQKQDIRLDLVGEVCGLAPSITYVPIKATRPELTGIVWNDERKRRPISGAKASLLQAGGTKALFSRHSDKSGTFHFQDLSAGEYDLRIAPWGYVEEKLKVLVPRENHVVVEVSLSKQGVIHLCP